MPLYLAPDSENLQAQIVNDANWKPNLSPLFLRALATALGISQFGDHGLPLGLTPEDIFHYTYALFHSPAYRTRYAEFLKIDFPRLPLTGRMELFRALVRTGKDLTAQHLLESPKLTQRTTEIVGGSNPVVDKISWSNNTVWLDARRRARRAATSRSLRRSGGSALAAGASPRRCAKRPRRSRRPGGRLRRARAAPWLRPR